MSVSVINKLLGGLLLAVASVVCLLPQSTYAAADLDDFQPGRIIDDAVMLDKYTMDTGDIQAFLDSKVPSCDTNGAQPASDFGRPDLTRAQYAASRGWQSPPYTCLKDWRKSVSARTVCGERLASGTRTAAKLIYDVSQACGINPQVLLVLLQKEQSLVTDTWPLDDPQYKSATGYGCPDGEPCDSQYFGLANQLSRAARMFQAILSQDSGWYTPYIKGYNPVVYWHPDTDRCGSASLTIQNWATASLYSYTPYRPNQAALNAGYGNGNSCSAYGNRNFYLYFNDWFGTSLAPDYTAQILSRSDSSREGSNAVVPGQEFTNSMIAKNVGTATWYDDTGVDDAPPGTRQVMLATQTPFQRDSSFGADWGSCGCRPARDFTAVYESDGTTLASNQHRVQPGQIAKWDITFKAPNKEGTYRERLAPFVYKKSGALEVQGNFFFDIEVRYPTYKTQVLSRTDSKRMGTGAVIPGATFVNSMTVKNTGSATWYDDAGFNSAPSGSQQIMLTTTTPFQRDSSFGADWGSCGCRPARNFTAVYEANGTTLAANQHRVQPGQIAKWDITFKAPSKTGSYRERIVPFVYKNSSLMQVSGNYFFDVEVSQPSYKAHILSRTNSQREGSNAVVPGQEFTNSMIAKNVGTATWYDDTGVDDAPPGTRQVMLATQTPFQRDSSFGADWGSCGCRPARDFTAVYESDGTTLASNQHRVQPGQIAKWDITFKAPNKEGTYRERLAPFVYKKSSLLQVSGNIFYDVEVR